MNDNHSRSTTGTPPSSRGAQILLLVHEILKDGQWHDYNKIVRAVTPQISRPVAARVGETDRVRSSHGRGNEHKTRRQVPTERTVQSGARTLIAGAMRSYHTWFERDGEKGSFRVRMVATPMHLRPYIDEADWMGDGRCPTCKQQLPRKD